MSITFTAKIARQGKSLTVHIPHAVRPMATPLLGRKLRVTIVADEEEAARLQEEMDEEEVKA